MTTSAEELLDALRADLRRLDQRLDDADFAGQLYRGLANRTWRRDGAGDGTHVALSWKRAEELINQLRGERGHDELTLAQTGGEGEVSGAVTEELTRLGWRSQPLNTDRDDPAHVESARDEPRTPPNEGLMEEAHAEAEQERFRKQQGAAGTR